MDQNANYAYQTDCLARDIAFEICLGGDRLDPVDVQMHLDGISPENLAVLKERVRLHCMDFPSGHTTFEEFVSRQIDSWFDGVRVGQAGHLWPGRVLAAFRSDKGKHFLFKDGSVRECPCATVYAAWGRDCLDKDIDRELSLRDVLARSIHDLVSAYGTPFRAEYDYNAVDFAIDAQSFDPEWSVIRVMESVDRSRDGSRVACVTLRSSSDGSLRTRSVNEFPEDMIPAAIAAVKSECELRRETLGEPVDLRVGVKGHLEVAVPEERGGGRLVVDSLFICPVGELLVHGKATLGGAEMTVPVAALGDVDIARLREATDPLAKSLAKGLKMPSLPEMRRKGVDKGRTS